MEASKVYYTDFRCPVGTSLLDKLRRVCIAAGIRDIDMDGKFVAIKMHFGELGNLAFLRPNYAKVVADLCKEQGGLPFLTDCNTLYPGSRKNALEHLSCAQLNGFWPMTTGCQVIIGDGLRGTDEVEVPVPNGEYCKTAKIGRAIMDADVFISLTHFKGHESTGFGGALKNIVEPVFLLPEMYHEKDKTLCSTFTGRGAGLGFVHRLRRSRTTSVCHWQGIRRLVCRANQQQAAGQTGTKS